MPDYAPFNAFGGKLHSWTDIDDVLRKAVKRGVNLRLILSERAYYYKHRKEHLLELLKLNKHGKDRVQIKVYQVRSFDSQKTLKGTRNRFNFAGLKNTSLSKLA